MAPQDEGHDDNDEKVLWRPNASWEIIKARAVLLKKIREFFDRRNVVEVETPILSRGTVTDPHISPFIVDSTFLSDTYYLQTSPEYAMKRLLADGADSIFQITKAFRNDEVGRKHNPEFTLLEWYRLDWDHLQLIDEVNELLCECLGSRYFDRGTDIASGPDIASGAEIISYHDLFQQYCSIDPHSCDVEKLRQLAKQYIDIGEMTLDDNDAWLDLLFTHCIEPHIGQGKPIFVVDYPQSQAALAQVVEVSINGKLISVAQRFEVFLNGVELANGYHELTDAKEQRRRFTADQVKSSRQSAHHAYQQPSHHASQHPSHHPSQQSYQQRPIDQRLLAAMESGLPPCAGVALGLDRLLMLAAGKSHLSDVLAFDFLNA